MKEVTAQSPKEVLEVREKYCPGHVSVYLWNHSDVDVMVKVTEDAIGSFLRTGTSEIVSSWQPVGNT